MKTIAAKAREIVELGAWCASLDLELVRLGDTLSFEWFGEHVHHRLVARNEYGENSGDCNRRSEGPHSRDLLCRLPAGHEGDHVLSKRWEE